MSFQVDTFYKIKDFDSEAISISDRLLRSNPLTTLCVETIGRDIYNELEFGLFSPGYQVITQGQSGKDLYLLCNHVIDVKVFDKPLFQVPTPTVIGFKGLVQLKPIYETTICVSEGQSSFIFKIPIAKFLKGLKNEDVEDSEFIREANIYSFIFSQMENHLYAYSSIQKNLWEEVRLKLNILNIQLISKIIQRGEEKKWDPKIWPVIQKYLLSAFHYSWPKETQFSIKALNLSLQTILNSFSHKILKSTDQEFEFKKQILWNKWLNNISNILINILPSNQLPISLGEIEIFNHQVYHKRIHNLLLSLEKNFMFKKIKPKEGVYDPKKLEAKNFFGKDGDDKQFNLDLYMDSVKKMFHLKNPNRVTTQIAQQAAQLTAKSDTEFNISISKMRRFLEKVQQVCASASGLQMATRKQKEINNEENVAILNKGYRAYNSRIVGLSQTFIGEIKYHEAKSPTITNLVKSCGTQQAQKQVQKAFYNILDSFELTEKNIHREFVQDFLFLCEASVDHRVSIKELASHYWIPISTGFCLKKEDRNFGTLKPGILIGGPSWAIDQTGEEEKMLDNNSWYLTIPKRQKGQAKDSMFLIMVIPIKKLPWIKNESPSVGEFNIEYLPLVQWMINRYLEHISILGPIREMVYKKYSKVVEVVVMEKKVRQFENNKKAVTDQQYQKIATLLNELLSISLEKQATISPEQISKQILTKILEQTRTDFPKLERGEQEYKAHTLWRFVQNEIISANIFEGIAETVKIESLTSVFTPIKEKIVTAIKKHSLEIENDFFDLSGENPYIYLNKLLNQNKEMKTENRLKLILSIQSILENYLYIIIEEIHGYQSRLKDIGSIKPEFDVKEIQSKFIYESTHRLQRILDQRLSD